MCIAFCLLFSLCVLAEEQSAARIITAAVTVSCDGGNAALFTDGKLSTHDGGDALTLALSSPEPLGGVYLKFREPPLPGRLNGETPIAEHGFLHDFIPLDGATSATLWFEAADICEMDVFSVGELPDEVQRWELGEPHTDLLLCATHSDDDQLFFAGLLPYYTCGPDVRVRVAYFINHDDAPNRTHELLDGLWHCGVKNYPTISPFPDGYSESAEAAALLLQRQGFDEAALVDFQRSLLETYRPQVAVLHDFYGEYRHGAHMLNTKTFVQACESAGESDYVPAKIYVHLYSENPLVLPIDEPLEEYGGLSAFQVSAEAFRFHKSQHWTWFYTWLYGKNGQITKASQIRSYNPAKYGLYYSAVGADSGAGDLLEHIEPYAVKERRAAEQAERERLERAKLAAALAQEGRLTAVSFMRGGARAVEEQAAAERTAFRLRAALAGGTVLAAIAVTVCALRHGRHKRNSSKHRR